MKKGNKMKSKLKTRMYVLVNGSLSQMQKGIQALHAVVEYGIEHPTEEYQQWATEDKTVIVLDGGTSNSGIESMDSYYVISYAGDMENNAKFLCEEIGIDFAEFRDPDVNNCLTAIAFIVNEKIYNYEKYPDYIDLKSDYDEDLPNKSLYDSEEHYISNWLGGEDNAKLREFLKHFKLAL